MSPHPGVWEELNPAPGDDPEGLKTAVEEVTGDAPRTAREGEAEAEPGEGTGHCGLTMELERMRRCCLRTSRGRGSRDGIYSW